MEYMACDKCRTVTHVYPTPAGILFKHHSLCEDCMQIEKELAGYGTCEKCDAESQLHEMQITKKVCKFVCAHCQEIILSEIDDKGD